MPNSFELMIHYLAGLRCGLVLTPLNYRYTVCDINDALELSGAKALLHHDERSAEISTSEASRLCELGLITATDQGLTHQLDDSAGSLPWSKQDPDQPCILFLSSGTLGDPKVSPTPGAAWGGSWRRCNNRVALPVAMAS